MTALAPALPPVLAPEASPLRLVPAPGRAPPAAARGRLVALDAFRGLMVAGMILVNDQGNGSHVLPGLAHASWNGVTLADLVFPGFLVAMGAAMAVSSRPLRWPRVLRRSLLLFAVGFGLNALPYFDPAEVHIMGVLQRIALCYLLASAVVLLLPRRRSQILLAAGILVGYWAVLAVGAGWGAAATPHDGGLVGLVDRALLGVRHVYGNGPVDPEGILSTLPALVSVLIGYWAGAHLRAHAVGAAVRRLAVAGAALVGLGLVWSPLFPLNKRLWTSSYTLVTAGVALLALAALQLLAAPGGRTRRLAALGTNALALYVLSEEVANALGHYHVGHDTARTWVWQHVFAAWAGPAAGSLLYASALLGAYWLVALALARSRVSLRL